MNLTRIFWLTPALARAELKLWRSEWKVRRLNWCAPLPFTVIVQAGPTTIGAPWLVNSPAEANHLNSGPRSPRRIACQPCQTSASCPRPPALNTGGGSAWCRAFSSQPQLAVTVNGSFLTTQVAGMGLG